MGAAAPVQYQPYGINANPNQPQAPASSAQAAPAPAVAQLPFNFSSKRLEAEGNQYSAQPLDGTGFFNSPIPAEGYIEAVEIDCNATGGVNGTKTVTAAADAPWNAISSLIVSDARGTQLHTLDGYLGYLVQRYLGGSLFAVENDTNSFTAVSTGSSGTGNFSFKLKVPVQYHVGGRGDLPNSNQSAAYKIATKFNTATAIYASASTGQPGTLPTLSGTVRLLGRIIPPPADIYGRATTVTPPIYKSYMVTESESVPGGTVNGQNTYYLARVGNPYRAIIAVFRASDGTRATAVSAGNFPSIFGLQIDTFVKYQSINVAALNKRIYEKTGLIVPAGVLVLLFDREILNGIGMDYSDVMTTVAGTSAKLFWTSSASGGTVQIGTADIVSPDGGLAITAGVREAV